MRKLTTTQINTRITPALIAIAVAGELIPKPSTLGADFNDLVDNHPQFTAISKIICKVILDRQFKNVDPELQTLAGYYFNDEPQNDSGTSFKLSAEKLALGIAWFCTEGKVYWDDTSKSLASKQEIDEFKTNTLLGQALVTYDCFSIKMHAKKTGPSAAQIIQSINNNTASKPTSATAAPASGYKQSGPHSKDAFDLKSAVGQKDMLSSPVYRISCKSLLPKQQKHPFIKPLSTNGQKNGTNKVFFGAGHGYTECEVFFKDNVKADAYLVAVKNSTIASAAVLDDLEVARTNALTKGYFLIGTEFGDAYISAEKLNEKLNTGNNSELLTEETAEQQPHYVDRSYRRRNREALAEMKAMGISYIDDPIQFAEDLKKEF